MKTLKKLLCAALALSLTLALTACGGQDPAASASASGSGEGTVYRIGISQYGEHPSLDNCRAGFLQGLEEAGLKEGVDFTVDYQNANFDDATATQVGEKLSTMPGVSGVQYVSKQDVLNIYRGYMEDYSSLWDEFESDNPFKANYRVTISDLSQMAAMSKKMQAIPGVYSVAAPVEMTNVFVEVQQAVTKGGRLIVLVLMIVSIITVGSTIRLSVFARRREIEIMKYVGATNALVTLPFVVEGLAMGLISGALTAGVSLAAYSYTVSAASTLGGLWQMIMGHALVPVANVWPTVVIYSLAGGALVGGLGSMFSIRKHLNV